MEKYYLSIDIGASSGRHILSHIENGKLVLEEIFRFENGMEEKDGHLTWNYKKLFENIVEGMKKCKETGKIPVSVGIDTWGVDYALIDKDDNVIGDVYAYRDSRTEEPIKKVHSIVPFEKLYERTGSQFQIYNTVYQLYADKLTGKLDNAEMFLMMPDFFNFLLTGVKKNEFTNASTTGIMSAKTRDWDFETVKDLDLPLKLFKPLSDPATLVGPVKPEIEKQIGYKVNVVLPATHDTASAVMAVPENGTPLYISSGTWSLLGIESPVAISDKKALEANFTNEGGYKRSTRFLKNIMGLWMIQCVRKEHEKKYSWADYVVLSKAVKNFDSIVDVNDPSFLAPDSMIEAIKDYCRKTNQKVPETPGEIALCVYDSLAVCYAKAIKNIEEITGYKFDTINIVGGGCQNGYLNELTAKRTGRKVIAGPVEATAIGNALAQLLYDGAVKDIAEAKNLVKKSFDVEEIAY
ncbi:MAG: rhamnulokinase [Clostridia bacterium]|nr:rhamnulokinase [Clostridia bacterium]